MNYDKIVVMKNGGICEMGHGYELLVSDIDDKQMRCRGEFVEMIKNTRNSKEIFQRLEMKYKNSKMK